MAAKRLIAMNWKDADQLKNGQWLKTFLEVISMEGAASHLSDLHNEELQLCKTIMHIIHEIPNFSRILRQNSVAV